MTVEDLRGYCRTCYYAEECKSGCNWTTHVLFGKVGDNPLCHHRALDLAQKGRRERIVKVQAAPGLPFEYSLFELVEEAFPEAEREPLLELANAMMKRPAAPTSASVGEPAPPAASEPRSSSGAISRD